MVIKHKIGAFLHNFFSQSKGMSEKDLEAYFSTYHYGSIKIEIEDYATPSTPNKTCNGKQGMRWHHGELAIAEPEHLKNMGLKFEYELEVAKSIGGN
jgi:hypothetical protein